MKAKYDPSVDALYVRSATTPIVETEEVRPGVMFDFDAEGRIVGIEVLDASEHLANRADLTTLVAARPRAAPRGRAQNASRLSLNVSCA